MNSRRGLAARLFAAQLLVIVAGSLTLALTALAVAPGLFRLHARQAFAVMPPGATTHLQRGFEQAMLVALGIAAAASLVTALAASWLLAQQLTRPIRSLAGAAERIGAGGYQARVAVPATGDEVATLAEAFNRMAQALESTERRRQALLADLAHELRTPLATLEGYVEGLADGVVVADQEAWAVLQAELVRLRRLVEGLETVSRAEERQLDLRLGSVDPGVLVIQAIQAAEPAYAAKGVDLQMSVDRALPAVSVDADRLGEVLGNLLGNALRHTPGGGRVQVSARGSTGQDQVDLVVADNGKGIPPELLDPGVRALLPDRLRSQPQRRWWGEWARADHQPGDRGGPRWADVGGERWPWPRCSIRCPAPNRSRSHRWRTPPRSAGRRQQRTVGNGSNHRLRL